MAVPRNPVIRSEARPFVHLVDLHIDAQPWMESANCLGTDPEAFFPEKGGSTREAKAVCSRCTVAAECLDYALEGTTSYSSPFFFGIWGGTSPRERRKLARQLFPTSQPEDLDDSDIDDEDLDNHQETA